MNALKTMVFGLAALSAVSLSASGAAATTILSYVGNPFNNAYGIGSYGERMTATIEVADPLGANFSGDVSWLSFAISDGFRTLTAPNTVSVVTDAAGDIVGWNIIADTYLEGGAVVYAAAMTNYPGGFSEIALQFRVGQAPSTLSQVTSNTPGVWTVTTRVDPGVVPEPAAWALMILGFGLAGVGLRRMRDVTAA